MKINVWRLSCLFTTVNDLSIISVVCCYVSDENNLKRLFAIYLGVALAGTPDDGKNEKKVYYYTVSSPFAEVFYFTS